MNSIPVTWARVAKVWWCFVWRATLLGMIVGMLVGLVVGFAGALVGMTAAGVEWMIRGTVILVSIPVGILVMKSVLEKEFSDFRIVLLPGDEESADETGLSG